MSPMMNEASKPPAVAYAAGVSSRTAEDTVDNSTPTLAGDGDTLPPSRFIIASRLQSQHARSALSFDGASDNTASSSALSVYAAIGRDSRTINLRKSPVLPDEAFEGERAQLLPHPRRIRSKRDISALSTPSSPTAIPTGRSSIHIPRRSKGDGKSTLQGAHHSQARNQSLHTPSDASMPNGPLVSCLRGTRLLFQLYCCFAVFHFVYTICFRVQSTAPIHKAWLRLAEQWIPQHRTSSWEHSDQSTALLMPPIYTDQLATAAISSAVPLIQITSALPELEVEEVAEPPALHAAQQDAIFMPAFPSTQQSSKLFYPHHDLHNNTQPFAFRALSRISHTSITACLFYNEAWLDSALDFAGRWNGPMSIVVEVIGSPSDTDDATSIIDRIASMRAQSHRLRDLADFHILFKPASTKAALVRTLRHTLATPWASNMQTNMARFFARTDMVWLVGDPRVLPSLDLHQTLQANEQLRELTMDYGDAVMVPVFGQAYSESSIPAPTYDDSAAANTLNGTLTTGLRASYLQSAEDSIRRQQSSAPVSQAAWPASKVDLLPFLADTGEFSSQSVHAVFQLHPDGERDGNMLDAWKLMNNSPIIDLHKIASYRPGFSPSVVIGRDRQPWCKERLECSRAPCIFQMHLSGAKMWLLSDGWAYTTENLGAESGRAELTNVRERMKASLASRLYSKYQAEACLHYGRAFTSMGMWNSERANNVYESCGRLLHSYGIGEDKSSSNT